MKKFFAMALAVCMMMTVMVLGDARAADGVLQDEQPPVVVTTVGEAGENIAAIICDAQGNAIGQIEDDGSMVLTDVHARNEAADAVIVNRLSSAYEGVMDDVHHSDVECLLHDHDVKVDINTVLGSLHSDIDAHDLVMYELFDVAFSAEEAALLADGGYVELTLEVDQNDGLPLITLFTPDGINWQVLPTTAVGDKRFTVQLTAPGTLALLIDGRKTMGIGEDVQRVVTVIPGEAAGEYGIDLSNFTPSVSGKSAPQMVTFEGADGQMYVGYIRSRGGEVEILVPDQNYIIVTSVAERDYVMDIQTHEHLEWGYDSILNVQHVGELMSDSHEGTIAADLDALLQEMNLDLTHDQLVVKDLFEVTAYGDYLHHLYNEDFYLEVTFDVGLDPEKTLVVIHSADSEYWHVHPANEATLNADGTVTLKMYNLGAVAFLVEAEDYVNAAEAVQSPN